MAYFKIGNNDYSQYVSGLSIVRNNVYTAQNNAAGDSVVDYINSKRIITATIIPLDNNVMKQLQTDIASFNVNLSFRNPRTDLLEENVECILPTDEVSYYTIQADKVMYNAYTLVFNEL